MSGAAIACYQFLSKDDAIVKQALKYAERILKVVNKIPAMADIKQAFELSLNSMKKSDRSSTDYVQGEIPMILQAEFEAIRKKDEEQSDPELWNPESLSFTYYNTLQ